MGITIHSAGLIGSKAQTVSLEACQSKGYAGLQTIGVHNDTSKGIREKVSTILEQLNIKVGNKKTLLNFSPHQGNHSPLFDLPSALSLYLLYQQKPSSTKQQRFFTAGELGLDGTIKTCPNALPLILHALTGTYDAIILPLENRKEFELIRKLNQNTPPTKAVFFGHIKDLFTWIQTGHYSSPAEEQPLSLDLPTLHKPDFDDMLLSDELKRLLCTSVIGRHNIFLFGTPGTGKSMMAARLPSLLPQLENQDHLQALKTHSYLDRGICERLMAGHAPFRAPHHLSSAQAILGTPHSPGDIALAHGGVLFLDELPEFRRDLLESLREPLESGSIQVSRAQAKSYWKCRIMLVAAANNCPCGWLGSRRKLCQCSQQKISAYQRKLSGPLMDRIDIRYRMPEPEEESVRTFLHNHYPEQQNSMKDKIRDALEFRSKRIKFYRNKNHHSLLDELQVCPQDQLKILKGLNKLLTRRSQNKVIQVARSIADYHLSAELRKQDFDEALHWNQGLEGLC